MKAVLGIVSLLVVLLIVGKLASTQLASLRGAAPSTASAAPTVPQQARQVQQQMHDDVTRALEQGAARRDAADQ